MSLVIHYWIGDVQDCQGVSAFEMTDIVSGGSIVKLYSKTAGDVTFELAYSVVQLLL